MLEQTLFIVKPDAQSARSEILTDVLLHSFNLQSLQQANDLMRFIWEQHYHEHKDRPFFPELIDFMTSGPSTIMILERDNAISYLRGMIGATKVHDAEPGTLRQRYAHLSTGAGPSTLVHASDSPESAAREIELWSRILAWDQGSIAHVF